MFLYEETGEVKLRKVLEEGTLKLKKKGNVFPSFTEGGESLFLGPVGFSPPLRGREKRGFPPPPPHCRGRKKRGKEFFSSHRNTIKRKGKETFPCEEGGFLQTYLISLTTTRRRLTSGRGGSLSSLREKVYPSSEEGRGSHVFKYPEKSRLSRTGRTTLSRKKKESLTRVTSGTGKRGTPPFL